MLLLPDMTSEMLHSVLHSECWVGHSESWPSPLPRHPVVLAWSFLCKISFQILHPALLADQPMDASLSPSVQLGAGALPITLQSLFLHLLQASDGALICCCRPSLSFSEATVAVLKGPRRWSVVCQHGFPKLLQVWEGLHLLSALEWMSVIRMGSMCTRWR